jgi:hypothetical protein
LEPQRAIAGAIAQGFVDWIAVRLAPEDAADPLATAARLLAVIEGRAMLAALGRADLSEAAAPGP